jgi:hypothetical protein
VLSDGDGNPRAYWDNNGSLNQVSNIASAYATYIANNGGNSNRYGVNIKCGTNSGTNFAILFAEGTGGTTQGYITFDGSGTTSYSSASDYRLKENIAPMTGALDKVAQLKPCTYIWKANSSRGSGFIAHELAEICPNAVVGTKDEINEDGSIKPQGIDAGSASLIALLTSAIQEQQAIIESLKARLDAANL